MEKLKLYGNKKREKGAITLFVLLACLFFVFILTGVYLSNLNRMQVQEQEVQQIHDNYAKDIDRVEEIYEELAKNVVVTLRQEPENGTNTKSVTLIGNAKVDEENTATIERYVFNQENTEDNSSNWRWQTVSGTNVRELVDVKQEGITSNGKYYFWVMDSEGEVHRSNEVDVQNIDNNKPEAGTLIAKEQNEDGSETDYDLVKNLWTDKDVKVEKVDGTDGEGEAETVYTILKNGVEYEDSVRNPRTEPTILTETGEYIVTVKTTDEAGNEAERKYTIKIDKVVPILALKHNDENGEEYEEGTWTKDDLYGEINIDTSNTRKEVEKYQYSYNGVIWNGISSEIISTSIDYTTTFPMSADKPEWINGPINNGNYYFEVQEDGTLKPSNEGSTGSTNKNTAAESYFEIDLSNYPEAELEVTINATISSENNDDFGYAEITESTDAIVFSENNQYYIKVSGATTTADHTTTIVGGKKYYLHIGYSKDSSSSTNQDTFIINSIRIKADPLVNKINFVNYNKVGNKVTFTLEEDIEKEIYVRAVYTDSSTSKYGDTTSIKIDKTGPVIEKAEPVITSREEARAEIKATDKGSGLKGYFISTEQTAPTESSNWTQQTMNEFTIENLSTNTTYYLWTIDNVGNISEMQEIVIGIVNYSVDDTIVTETIAEAIAVASDGSTIKLLGDYTDTSAATFNKSVTFDIQSYTLTRQATITINSGKTVEITGTGKITSGTSSINTITNNGTLTVSNNVTIENMSTSSSYAPIRNNSSSAITNIEDNVQIIGYYRGIYNYYGTLNVNGGKIEATYSSSSAYGIYNYSRSTVKLNMTTGEVKGYYGIYNGSSAALEMTGGKVIGTGAYGINALGTTNIYGGRIEGKTYGVYSNSSDKVTIGREEEELNTTNPAIYGASYGIYMNNETHGFNFYNGVIISNTKETAYRGVLNPRTGYMPYTYFDYDTEQKYCTILIPTVENITMEATPTEYTNENVIVKITYPYNNDTKQYSENGTEWKEVDQYVQEVTVAENRTIYARTTDESGVVTDENQIVVDNIDKEIPTVEVSPSQTSYTVIETDGTMDLNITISAKDTGVSGLDKVQYAWVEEGEEINYTDFESTGTTITKNKLGIGQYNLYFNVTDKAGNKAEIVQIRYIVKYAEPVAQIGDTKYATIQEAIEACSKEAGDAQTTITIIKDTDEEFVTYEGQNIILDLNGYTIGSSSLDTPLCTNNGKLQIIDTSANKTGKIESLNNVAIQNNGEITIGDNSTSIENDVPTIYGYKVGIENNNIFNFYDGKIQGITPIQGNTTDAPAEYGPVSTEYNNGITTVQLGIVSGYEARIEWVYYTTVQEAVNASKIYSNDYRDTVTIIKDIQLTNILEINASKNIILDLYGYTLTISSEYDTVINNYGNLEIEDSSIEQTGEINIISTSICFGIYNNGSGTVEVTRGTVSSSNISSRIAYSYGIYNASSGNIKITGGTVSSSSSGSVIRTSFGICNASSGSIEVIEGTISAGSYGIYNASSGIVKVAGGTVSSSSGIYNKSTGSIEVTGGVVSGGSYGIYNFNDGNIGIAGGTISGDNYGIYNYRGITKVTEGTVNSSSTDDDAYGIYNPDTGSIEVTGGTINSSSRDRKSYGIYNSSTGNIKMAGGTVNSCGDDINYGIYNKDSGNIEVTGGTVNSCGDDINYGIYNEGSGNIEVTGGIVNSSSNGYGNSYGMYNKTVGTIIIGTIEDEIVQKVEPTIIGQYLGTSTSYNGYGIYNGINGEIEFYNGIIQGNLSLSGTVTKIRDGYKIEKNIIYELESIYLVEKSNTEYVVQIDETKYYTLKEAIESIGEEEKTIQVLRNFELDEKIEFNKNIILDLNGCTITNNYYEISNIGNLTITDTTEDKQGKIECIEKIIGIKNNENGNLNITEGTVSSSSDYSYGIYNDNTGIITINGGTVISSSNSSGYGIYNASNGSIEIISGTLNGGIYNASSGSITLTGGTVNSEIYGIYNNSTGNIEITGGIINSTSNNSNYGIYNYSTGNINMTGGTINSSSSTWASYGIYNYNDGIIKVIGGTVIGRGGSYSTGYGIYNESNGTIILGAKGDGIVSQENPLIKGIKTYTYNNGYGIYNIKGKFYFYDGKIEGSTKAVYETITEKEEETEFNYNEDETILTLSTVKLPVAQIGDITYTDLQEAINSVTEERTIIKIIRNITYTKDDLVIIVPKTKNIILDLNGYKIVSSIIGKSIQNEGELEIIDTSENKEGIITTSEETTIFNTYEANLIISEGTIENKTKYAIKSEGNIIIKGGIVRCIRGNNDIAYGIYNANSGSIEITGGTISSKVEYAATCYGIYNASSGNIKITGGTINTQSEFNTENYGIYNSSIGTINILGGTINTKCTNTAAYSYGIYNKDTGKVNIKSGTVNSYNSYGDSYGIYNENTGIIEIIGGTVSSNGIRKWDGSEGSFGIYNNSTGTVIVGIKGDGTVSQEGPLIKATKNLVTNKSLAYGIYNSDGILYYYDGVIQGIDRAIYGNLNEIDDLTKIIPGKEVEGSYTYQTIVLEQETMNSIIMNNVEYDSISKVIKESGTNQNTIKLLKDTGAGADVMIEASQNIIIDLNGYTLSNYNEITNNGTLKIIDTSAEQSGKIIGATTEIAISNKGTLELNTGTITDSTYGIKNTGTLNITGGKIENTTYGIYNDSNGNVTITSCTITSNIYGIYNYASTNTTNINGGIIYSNEYGIYNYNGTTNLNNVEMQENEYSVYNAGGTTNVATTITGTTYGVYNAGGTTNIKEGAEVQSNTGIYVAKGTVNIGEQGTMNPDSPIIIGETYGLSVSGTGTVYMYDGQIKGKTGATQGFITYTETGYAVANKVEGEYFVDYLVLAGTISTVAEVNGVSYSNLQSAINSITGTEPQTIKLTNGIITTMTFNIAEGQNIILDMNEKTISSDLSVTINNAGNLTIIDSTSSGVGKISSTTGTAIVNSGALTLGQDDGTVSQDLITIEGNTYGIENTGELNFYDGTINGASAVNGTITNRATGYVIRITTVNGKERYYLST